VAPAAQMLLLVLGVRLSCKASCGFVPEHLLWDVWARFGCVCEGQSCCFGEGKELTRRCCQPLNHVCFGDVVVARAAVLGAASLHPLPCPQALPVLVALAARWARKGVLM